MAISIFKIGGGSDIENRWGDYGHILQHGMANRLPGTGGLLALERTGPFIPPITLPGLGHVILASSARRLLESSGLTGFSFQPVKKVLTVELHWENWDLRSEDPPYFPDSGEPEDYILGQPDNPAASAALGELWELIVPATARILHSKLVADSYKDLLVELGTWNGADLFRSDGYATILFSERGRAWFKGGCCDCEVLYNLTEKSRLKAEYWKSRASGQPPKNHTQVTLLGTGRNLDDFPINSLLKNPRSTATLIWENSSE